MAIPLVAEDTLGQATAIQESTAQAESRVQNEELLGRVGETISGIAPVLAGAAAGAFANSPTLGLATAFVADKLKQANREKAERRRQKRLEGRQRREAAKILVAQGKVANKREALAMIDEGILRNAEKAEQQRQDNLLAGFDLNQEQKDTEQQREENTQTERDNLETRVENAEIERETLQGMGAGLALESTVASIDNNISAIGDLILDRFADQERSEKEQNTLQKQQLLQQRELRLEAERTQERDDGEPEKVKEQEDKGSGLMRIIPMLLAGLTGLVSLVGGVTGALLGKAGALGLGAVVAGATGLKNLVKGKPKVDADVEKVEKTEKDTIKSKKKTGALTETKETMGDKAAKQSPKKGGISDAIKKFKRVAKKVGFKRLALLIGKRVGTAVAASIFTGPFAIIVGLIGAGLAVADIMSILDEVEKEFDEGKSVDGASEPQIKEGESQAEFVKRRSDELIESGEITPVTDSNRSREAAIQKARSQAFREYRESQVADGDGKPSDATEPKEPVKDITADELAKMSPEEAKSEGHIDFADQDDLNDRIEELRMKEKASGAPEQVETKQEFIKRRTREIVESGEADARLGSARSQTAAFRKARLMAQAEYVQREPRGGQALASTSRQQTAQPANTNVVDNRTTQSTTNQVNNTSNTMKSAPLQPKNNDMSNRFASRYN